jgi:uncharacterized protein
MLSECIDSVELRKLAMQNTRQQTCVDAAILARDFRRLAGIVRADRYRHGSANDSESLFESSVGLAIDVRFEEGAEGYPCIRIAIDGHLNLECQRCLQPVGFPVSLEARLTILGCDTQTPQISNPFDSVVMTADGLNLLVIVEDELLSTLPIAPIHETGTKCAQSGSALYKSEIEAVKPSRPFSGLAPLLGAADEGRED